MGYLATNLSKTPKTNKQKQNKTPFVNGAKFYEVFS